MRIRGAAQRHCLPCASPYPRIIMPQPRSMRAGPMPLLAHPSAQAGILARDLAAVAS